MANARPKQERSDEQEDQDRLIGRRGILRWAMWGSFLFAAVNVLGGFINLFWPREVGAFGGEITVGKPDEYPVDSVTRFNDGRFYLVHLEQGFEALWWVCPHLGCTVPWIEDEELFICPCHGSTYTPDGQIISGPAPRPMDMMALSQNGSGNLVVDTGEITERPVVEDEHFFEPEA